MNTTKWRTNVFKKIFNIAGVIVFILLSFCCIRNTARSYRYRDLCNKYTEQLYAATETNRTLNDRLSRITEVAGRLSETANASITDARSIVETVERLRTEVQELEDCCGSFNQCEYYQYWDNIYGIEQ